MLKRKWFWALMLFVILGLGAGFDIWPSMALEPTDEALAATESDDLVEVDIDLLNDWMVFSPLDEQVDTAFVIYPGAKVHFVSYSIVARRIAQQGYMVVLVHMPFNLAVLGIDRASGVIKRFPEIEYWAVGGHSLGGAMAARYVYKQETPVDGLVLWAAYPSAKDDLSGRDDLEVVSIYGSRDGLATVDDIEKSRELLPDNARWVEIEGGNHAQFGDYGVQNGDLEATINVKEQQDVIVEATSKLLHVIEGKE